MRGSMAWVISVAIAGGACTPRQQIAGGGAALAVVGLGLTFSTEGRNEDELGTGDKIGIGMMLTGLVTLFVAAALEESEAAADAKPKEIRVATTPPEIAREDQRAQAAAQQKRDQAWALTKQAQEAARAGDCAKVQALSPQVGAIDPAFYADVFMADVAIQGCFVPTATPPAPAATQPLPSVPPTVTP